MNITEEHLHHMARRHHATMKKLDGMRAKIREHATKFTSTVETSAGAWLGGALEGRTGGASIGPLPINLGVGALLLVAGHAAPRFGQSAYSDHLNHLGDGFIGSWAAATGYAFGKRWKETGKITGGGGHPWTHPYENGWSGPGPGPAPAP